MTSPHCIDPALASALGPALHDVAQDLFTSSDLVAGADAAWKELETLGLTRLAIEESEGGDGGTLRDAVTVVVLAARHALPLPLGDAYLANWLRRRAGLPITPGMSVVAAPSDEDNLQIRDGRVSGLVSDVPWAEVAATVVAVAAAPDGATHVVTMDPHDCEMQHGQGLAGEPRATLAVDLIPVLGSAQIDAPTRWLWLGALVRTAQIVGALEATYDMTLQYAQEREQFGRPIAQFQAVQEHLVTLAQDVELARVSLWRAVSATQGRDTLPSFEIAAAKILANECARRASAAAHQTHGAMGMTREYPLHRYTTRLAEWRKEWGAGRQLMSALGTAALGHPQISHLVTDPESGVEVPWASA